MSLVFGMAAHQLAVATATANPLIPDPPPMAPSGLTQPVRTILGWMKWGTTIAGVIGLTICAMMMVGRRSRSTVAADGAAGIPWVLLGLMLASASSAIVGVFL
jgi:hypothetical protein